MQESNLFKVAIICSLIGIFVLLMISEHLEPEHVKISSIKLPESNGIIARIKGEVTNVKKMTGLTIITVKDSTGEIPAILFEDFSKINKSDFIELTGEITEYNEKPEMIINTLKCLHKS